MPEIPIRLIKQHFEGNIFKILCESLKQEIHLNMTAVLAPYSKMSNPFRVAHHSCAMNET